MPFLEHALLLLFLIQALSKSFWKPLFIWHPLTLTVWYGSRHCPQDLDQCLLHWKSCMTNSCLTLRKRLSVKERTDRLHLPDNPSLQNSTSLYNIDKWHTSWLQHFSVLLCFHFWTKVSGYASGKPVWRILRLFKVSMRRLLSPYKR